MIDFGLLRNRQSSGNISLGRQDPMTDPMYAGQRVAPGQFMQQGSQLPDSLRAKMLAGTADVVGDRWGLGSLPGRLGWFRQ